MDIAEAKRRLRKEVLGYRDAIPEELRLTKSRKITEKLESLEAYRTAELVLLYASYRSEADTSFLMERALQQEKKVYLPKVQGEDMEFYRIMGKKDLIPGYRGIPEPEKGELLVPDELTGHRALMVMPGAVFDRERHRIGYGRGYYDRYLTRLSVESVRITEPVKTAFTETEESFTTVAVCFAEQLMEKIPCEDHDILPQLLVTDCGIY